MVRLETQPSPAMPEDIQQIFDDLPTELYSDEPPLETDFHREQIDLLIRLLKYWWQDRPDFYISGNLTVYYNKNQLQSRDFRGPDIFVVLNTPKTKRRSWVLWEEGGQYPNVVIELLSDSTAAVDRGPKKDLYQEVWRVPEYFWFHPETLEFQGFQLLKGKYVAITPTQSGRLWSDQLKLYLGIHAGQLRWFSDQDELIPLPEEQERQAKDLAQERVRQLEELLRSHGIDPNNIG